MRKLLCAATHKLLSNVYYIQFNMLWQCSCSKISWCRGFFLSPWMYTNRTEKRMSVKEALRPRPPFPSSAATEPSGRVHRSGIFCQPEWLLLKTWNTGITSWTPISFHNFLFLDDLWWSKKSLNRTRLVRQDAAAQSDFPFDSSASSWWVTTKRERRGI